MIVATRQAPVARSQLTSGVRLRPLLPFFPTNGRGLSKKLRSSFDTVVMAIMRQPGQPGHMRGHHGPAWGLQGSLCYREWPRVPVARV